MDSLKADKLLYDYIFRKSRMFVEYQPQQPQAMSVFNHGYMVLHCLFKLIIVAQFNTEDFIIGFINTLISTQIVITLVIVDFWFTKNVLARGLIGLRWFFGDDQNGVQRFKYEARINKQFVNVGYRRLFWVVQGIYLLFSYLDFTALFAIEANIYHIVVVATKVAGATANLFMFYKINRDAQSKRNLMKESLGNQMMRKMERGSFVVCF